MIAFRKSAVTAAKSAILAAVVASSFALAGTSSAHAGGFGFDGPMMSDSGNDAVAGFAAGLAVGIVADAVAHSHPTQAQFDANWDALGRQDEAIHLQAAGHFTNSLQRQHDCLHYKKVMALLDEMNANLDHYINDYSPGPNRDYAIRTEKADIKHWEGVAREAKAECDKWYY